MTTSTETKSAPSETAARKQFISAFVAAATDESADTFSVRLAYANLPTDRTVRGSIVVSAMRAAMKKNPDEDRLAQVADEATQAIESDPALVLATQLHALTVAAEIIQDSADPLTVHRAAEMLADGVTFDADTIAQKFADLASRLSRAGGTRERRHNGHHGSAAAEHVTAWLEFAAGDTPRGEFISYSTIAGPRGEICTVPDSPYFNRPNPSAGAIANYLTGSANDLSNGGVYVDASGKNRGWVGTIAPRGLEIRPVFDARATAAEFQTELAARREQRAADRA